MYIVQRKEDSGTARAPFDLVGSYDNIDDDYGCVIYSEWSLGSGGIRVGR